MRTSHVLNECGDASASPVTFALSRFRGALHEEVESREGREISGEPAKVRVDLAGEAHRAGDIRHSAAHASVKLCMSGV